MIRSRQDRTLVEKFIHKVPLFRDISEKYLEQIVNDFSILHAKKDEVIITQADTSTDLYIVLKGKVKVTLLSEGGEEYILSDLVEGDIFGEMSHIDGKPRSATVVAGEDSTFGVLKRESLIDAIKQNPMIALDLLMTLVNKLRKATEREERFAFLHVRERLLKLFGELVRSEGKRDEKGLYVIEKRTQRELALRIGASREATSQVLRALASEGIIKEQDGLFLILPNAFETELI
jgi:CRP/FNR family transcriptional regulator/CRP/FNR family cyclic AMP-dependent transcriptional regulator